jgi:hypothetical protein
VTRIGSIVATPGLQLRDGGQALDAFRLAGFDHFSA